MQLSTLSNFPSWAAFEEFVTQTNLAQTEAKWSLLWQTNYNTAHSIRSLPVLLQHKLFSSCTHLLKRWEDPKWMFTTEYFIIQILSTLQYFWRAGKSLYHEQMSTIHTQLLQKRSIYHYPQILSWKALFLLTFTTWTVFRNETKSYFSRVTSVFHTFLCLPSTHTGMVPVPTHPSLPQQPSCTAEILENSMNQ